jgi:hypothetical protein
MTDAKQRCMGTIEWHTHTTYWSDCVLTDGHKGPCMDEQMQRKVTERHPPVVLDVGYDANGSPL